MMWNPFLLSFLTCLCALGEILCNNSRARLFFRSMTFISAAQIVAQRPVTAGYDTTVYHDMFISWGGVGWDTLPGGLGYLANINEYLFPLLGWAFGKLGFSFYGFMLLTTLLGLAVFRWGVSFIGRVPATLGMLAFIQSNTYIALKYSLVLVA